MTKCPKVKAVKNFVFFIHTPYKGLKRSGKNFHDVTKTGTLWKNEKRRKKPIFVFYKHQRFLKGKKLKERTVRQKNVRVTFFVFFGKKI